MEKWYARTVEETLDFWRTDEHDGLSTADVKIRLEQFGYNEMRGKAKVAWWKRFLAQFQDFMVVVLLAATLISAFLGEYVDAVTILAIVIINALLGFFQEYRAERSMEALKKLTAPTARVVRNGVVQHIPARQLVPGDVLMLEAGDIIAADGRLIGAINLEVEEAALTGEALPVRKLAEKIYSEEVTLGDRKNMIYSGTVVTRGRGKATVCSIGMQTEVGNIYGMIQQAEPEDTPLQRRLDKLGKWLVWGCLGICLIVVITGVSKGEPIFLMCMAGISLAVAAIPEGLPAIVTVALALGVQRMIKHHAIVRKLPAVETLGCTTVICSDKTGTLTQNEMTVRKIYTNNKLYDVSGAGYEIKGQISLNKQDFDAKRDKSLMQCLEICTLCNNSVLKHNDVNFTGLWRKKSSRVWSVEGDPTEGALVVVAGKTGIWKRDLEKTKRRLAEIPFEAQRRRMSVAYAETGGRNILYTKGALDTILDLCRYYHDGTREMPLTPAIIESILKVNDSLTQGALRVLAMAYRRLEPAEVGNINEACEHELVFAGLVGMIDPPREDARQAISICHQAGIKTVMITGDHRNTAMAIATELNMFKEGEDKAITGIELDKLNEKQLIDAVDEISVYARVSPAHKLRIVKALKAKGHIVAMTGDGVNDAPAVKEADIGVAMGMTGTDVTREASAMTLADDNFATIVAAVESGRGIYDNIRKFIRYLLAGNTGEVLTMFIASLAGMPMPLLPAQILWVNLVTDGFPAMALGVDPGETGVMNRPPRNPAESIFSRGLSRKIVARGFQIGLSTVLVFAAVYYGKGDLPLARTMALTTLVFCQLFHVYDCRSETKTIFEAGFIANKYLVAATVGSVIMQLVIVYVPFLRNVFSTTILMPNDWLLILAVAGWTTIIGAVKHFIFRRRPAVRSVRAGYNRH
ncbi:MAG: calcium-transporting P-type ATPase, PMR1-type [Firmicutes bacterium]|nr:calcium-transporting P-type ATPase, PMR1-type [Bacillota bacterium]